MLNDAGIQENQKSLACIGYYIFGIKRFTGYTLLDDGVLNFPLGGAN